MGFAIQDSAFRHLNAQDRYKIWAASTWKRFRSSWTIFVHNWLAVLGVLLLLIYVLMALLHPLLIRTIWPKSVYDPVVGHDINIFPHPSSPSLKHPLGTDTLGRDVLSILMAATAPSLQMALTAALVAAAFGTSVGALSAYFGGTVDAFFTHLADIALLMPAPIIMVIIGFVLDIGPFKFGLLYGILVGIGGVAIVLRSHALTIVNKSFIDAAKVSGGGSLHIITRHLIPHLLPLAAVNMLLTVTGAIFANGFVAFLGLSRAQLNWGSMIYDSFTYQQINGAITWNVLIPSSLAISLFAASFYCIALGLQDVVDPRAAKYSVPDPRKEKELRYEVSSKKDFAEPTATEVVKPALEQSSPVSKPAYEVEPIATMSTARRQSEVSDERVESVQVTFLVASLSSTATLMKTGSTQQQEEDIQDHVSEAIRILQRNGGHIEHVEQSRMMASFGLTLPMPPQVGALMAIQAGIEMMEYAEVYGRQHGLDERSHLRVSAGIASGMVTLPYSKGKGRSEDVLSGETGQSARKLHLYTNYMKSSCMLISEETFSCLAAVKHHFVFGRRGPAQLPGVDGQKMVYEIVGRTNISRED